MNGKKLPSNIFVDFPEDSFLKSNFSKTLFFISFNSCSRLILGITFLYFLSFQAISQTSPVFQNLFNGKDFEGWHIDVPAMDNDKSVKTPFIIRNGLMVSLASPGGHIITDAVYSNYTLEVVYRFAAKPGNCGVLVHCSKPRRLYEMFPQSIECQLMNKRAGDFWLIGEEIEVKNMEKYRKGPKENWGYDGKKERQIKHIKEGAEKPVGQWNTMKITCVDDKITVWVNGILMNQGFNASVKSGQIALQAEGSEVEFKKIMLRQF